MGKFWVVFNISAFPLHRGITFRV